jgi:mono/diheme cytochrome c family protein
MKTRIAAGALAGLSLALAAFVADAGTPSADAAKVARGRYLVTIGGCNDCHTPGFMQQGLKVAEKEWLTGLPVGFQGPWGTTYPANLRLVVNGLSESEWVVHARQDRLPPMPAYALQQMRDDDLKAIYAYVKSLGPNGVAAPAYVAPGGKVNTPYFVFVPQSDGKVAQAAK